jgi:imidazoleglycerol-phosphate dehydratase
MSSAVVVRETKETTIRVELKLQEGASQIDTGKVFFDHMLNTFARYAGLTLNVTARGDLVHHLMEDVAIAIGEAFRRIVPATCARYGDRTLPMDDVLVQAAVDLGGRFYYRGPIPNRLYRHFMRSFADAGRLTLHVRILRKGDRHHLTEACFKAVGLAVRQALVDSGTVFSTKGSVSLEVK